MKPRLLILPASIRSHVLPSLYLADMLAKDYEVVYAVSNDILADIVTANGYRAVRNSGFAAGYNMESGFLSLQKKKSTYWQLFNAFRKNELYHYRKQELDAIIDDLRPEVVIIDLFVCTDYWAIAHRKNECKILFFNPMPSTHKVKGYPTVSEGYWIKSPSPIIRAEYRYSRKVFDKVKFVLKSPSGGFRGLMSWAINKNRRFLEAIAPLATTATVTQVIADITELLLAPLEFEFGAEVCQPNQYYLGLCMRPHRQDTELDPNFEAHWPDIVAQKQAGQRLIYCSFGTFYEGADATLLRFIKNLMAVLNDIPNVQLLCTTNKYLIETLYAQKLLAPNRVFVSRVPQMQVLAEADVFITHGGFGSIKEAIYYGVPMLAYPLDLKYDQLGNALKVEQHGLGLRGTFAHERPNDLKTKLLRLLTEPIFKNKVAEMSTTILEKYTDQYVDAQLDECLS